MADFVFEIFSEEIPATLQKKIAIDYKQFAEKELRDLKLEVKDENIFIGITLNRLVLIVKNIAVLKEQLLNFIDKTLKEFSKTFPRTMCYPQLEVRWIRPIRGLFACIDNNVLSGKYYGIELKSGIYIDKFNFVECKSFDEYCNVLKDKQIEIDYNKRLEFVKNEIYNFDKKNIIKETNNQDDNYKMYWLYNNKIKLAEEIAGMSEYCVEPMIGTLEERFYILPFELIELVLRENQRYVVFKIHNKENKFEYEKIQFLIFGDKITKNEDKRASILNGHKKVVNARLDDALYYWQLDKIKQDKCGSLDKYKEYLKNILSNRIFIDDISYGDYLKKQEELAEIMIKDVNMCNKVKQLIWDTKLDLASCVVAEFPELQGVIGNYYFQYQEVCRTKKDGEKLDISINPYVLMKEYIKSFMKMKYNDFTPIAYFYLIDRITYIQIMYQQGKQPTGSGDKYKVKARMDDIVALYVSGVIKQINCEQARSDKSEIRKLFIKRYQKYIEDNYKDVSNIKQIANACSKVIEKKEWFDLPMAISSISNASFIKTYKRINGYTKNVDFVENNNILQKVKEIYKNEDNEYIDDFLDKNKIDGSELIKQALRYIEVKYFEPKLPVEFLEVL